MNSSVDPATGRVERVLQSMGPEGTTFYALGAEGRPAERHPDAQELLKDIQLPDWEHTVTLSLRAATALPGVRYQSWDIVIGPEGPLFLEVNHHGATVQIPGCRGFNDATFRAFIKTVQEHNAG